MIHFFSYLLEASLGLALAHLTYRFFLRKHTKFQINRIFLLLFIGLSLSIPLIEFSVDLSPDTVLANGLTYVESLETGWGEAELAGGILTNSEYELESGLNVLTLLSLLYVTGLIVYSAPILLSWKDLINLISKTPKQKKEGFIWLESPDAHSFSAFHYIFLSKELNQLPKSDQDQIIQHEKVHAKGWHSLDLLFIDFLRMVFWFHPLKNRLKKDLQELHECLADATVTQVQNKHQYSRLIVQLAHNVGGNCNCPLPVHSFAYSPIKHRIFMLLKKPTKSIKYLIIPGLCAFTFMITMACSFEMDPVEEIMTSKSSLSDKKEKEYQLIIDAVNKLVQEVEAKEEQANEFIYPLEGKIVSGYGMRVHPLKKKRMMHMGIDLSAAIGTPVKATADGEVILFRKASGGYGNQVEIQHGSTGFVSKYAQLSEIKVKKGQIVKQGDIIALTGSSGASTGPHLHFEIIKEGKKVNPEKYLKR